MLFVQQYFDFGDEAYNVQHVVGTVIETSRFQESIISGSVSGGSVHVDGRNVSVTPPVTTLNTKIDYIDKVWVRFSEGQEEEITIVNADAQFLTGHEIIFSYLENGNEELYLTSIANKNTNNIVKLFFSNSLSAQVNVVFLDENKKVVRSGQRNFWRLFWSIGVISFLLSLVFAEDVPTTIFWNLVTFGVMIFFVVKMKIYNLFFYAPLEAALSKYESHFESKFPDIISSYIRKTKIEN
tara:strand:- start:86 stop:802 length:717 start_codon:yes stop_codon:yes gene_type:complete